MTSITDTERNTYADIWELPHYQNGISPGEEYLRIFSQVAAPGATVLDAGCGNGKGTSALMTAGYHLMMCDVTDAGVAHTGILDYATFIQTSLWNDLRPAAHRAKAEWYEATCGPCPFDGVGFDWVYCCDVLEHIPPQFTMLAVDQMLRVAKQGVFLTVSTQPDAFGVWVGRPLHQTVQGFQWWRDSLSELTPITEARDLVAMAVFVLEGYQS